MVATLAMARSATADNYGDAPGPYPAVVHTNAGGACDERLGATCLDDSDGANPVTPAWTGSTDDDGLIVTNLVKGGTATIIVNFGSGYLSDDVGVWVDWNDDGDWDDADEQVIWAGGSPAATDGALVGGNNVFDAIAVPVGAVGTSAKIRARMWYTDGATAPFDEDGGGAPTGTTEWGEVEDYEIAYWGDPEIDVQRPAGTSLPLAGTDVVGPLQQGVATTLTWTIENFGTTNPLSLTGGVTITNETNCTATLSSAMAPSVAAGATTTFDLDITPTAVGAFSFDFAVANDDADENPYTVTVEGTGGDLFSGTFLISNDAGESPDFASLGEAFEALEAVGTVGGPVTFEISAGTGAYTSDATYMLGDTAVGGLSETNTITIINQTGERPVITGSGTTLAYGESGTLAISDISHVIIQGIEFTGGTDFGIALEDTGGNVSGFHSIVGCRIHDISAGNGIYVTGDGSSVDEVAIVNNFIWDVGIGTSAIVGYGEGAIGFFNVGSNTVILHNTIVVASGAAGGVDVVLNHAGSGAPLTNVSYNVFVAGTTGFGQINIPEPGVVDCFTGSAVPCIPAAADYNVYFMTGGAGPFNSIDADLAAWQTRSSLDANSVATDPALVNIAAGSEDLHLTSGSANAIDMAIGSTLALDIDGNTRPEGSERDIGADEYVATAGAPVIAVTADGTVISDSGTLVLNQGDTVAGASLVFTVTDTDVGDTLDLVATVTASADIDGFVQTEWNATGTGGTITATPATGTFDTVGSITVALAASDGTGGTASMSFTIEVNLPTADPAIAVTAGGSAVTSGGTVNVNQGDTVASAALVFTVTDADTGDTVDLTATVVQATGITGFVASEWNATGTGGTITATPASGTFSTAGSITVSLAADDNVGGTDAFSFTIAVSATGNNLPVIGAPTATGNIAIGGSDPSYTGTITVGGNLGLSFAATDADAGDTLSFSVAVTGGTLSAPAAGFSGSFPYQPTGGVSPHTVTIAGSAAAAGTIELTVTVSDGNGGSDSYTITITITGDGGGDDDDDGGGCCRTGKGGANGVPEATLIVLLGLAFDLVRRRRRRREDDE